MRFSPIHDSRPPLRSWASILLFLCMCLWACSGGNGSETDSSSWPSAEESGQGELRALYVAAEGFAYRDEAGNLTGFTVELLRNFSDFAKEKYGVEVEIHFEEETDWREFYRRIVEGEDGMIGLGNVTITEERKEELVFSPPYMTNMASLITHRDSPELLELEDLASRFEGRNALAFEGTLHEERLRALTREYFPDAEVYKAHSNDEIIERVSSADEYFAYIDMYNYQRAAERGFPLQHHPVADLSSEQFGYIMPLETTWEAPIRAYFEQGAGLIHSREYRSLMVEHLGEELAAILLSARYSD